MIKRFGFLDTAQTGRSARAVAGEVRHSCRFVGFWRSSVVILFISAASPALAQRNNDASKQPARSAQEQQDVQALVQTVELALLSDLGIQVPAPGAPPPTTPPTAKPLTLGAPDSSQGELPIKWESNHFVKGQTDTYIPFTLVLDRATSGVGRRALDPRGQRRAGGRVCHDGHDSSRQAARQQQPPPPVRTTFAWDNGSFVDVPEGGKLSRAIQLRPGQYVAYIAIKEKSAAAPAANQGEQSEQHRNAPPPAAAAPGKVGLLRHEITVPDFGVADLTTSSVILARSVEQVAAPPADQESNPYVFGPMRIVPSPDGKFAKSAELSVIFWIYGAQAAATGKPDVTIEYNFHQKLAEGEKYFNKTAPQQLNAKTLPPEFNVAAGHQLPGSLVVPVDQFPDRRLSAGDQDHRQDVGQVSDAERELQRSAGVGRARTRGTAREQRRARQ